MGYGVHTISFILIYYVGITSYVQTNWLRKMGGWLRGQRLGKLLRLGSNCYL